MKIITSLFFFAISIVYSFAQDYTLVQITDSDNNIANKDTSTVIFHLTNNRDTTNQEPASELKPFLLVEQMPVFPGGNDALMKFINETMVYPKEVADKCFSGRVVARFVVQPDGSISDIKIVRSIDPVIDKEAIRVIQAMPKWQPGKQNGKYVPVYWTLPMRFPPQKSFP